MATFSMCEDCGNIAKSPNRIKACKKQGIRSAYKPNDFVEYKTSSGRAIGKLGVMHVEKKSHRISFTCISAGFGTRDVGQVKQEKIIRKLTEEEIAALPH